MIYQMRKIFIELFLFLVSLGLVLKGFYFLESKHTEDFTNIVKNESFNPILVALLLISMLFSAYICHKNKKHLKPIKFMQTNKQKQKLEWKKLISKKEGLFLVALVVFFYYSYNNIIQLNDYSQQALFIVLVFYCPISTIITINNRKKQNEDLKSN